jgi:putative transposase
VDEELNNKETKEQRRERDDDIAGNCSVLINTLLQLGVEELWNEKNCFNSFSATGCALTTMSLHSYSKMWVHLVWATLDREPMLSKSAAAKASAWLNDYAAQKKIYLKINFFNADHVHALIDLPTNLAIEDVVQLFKGASSHWINEQKLVAGRFGWGRGYGAFSVSESGVGEVARYIADQEEHHRKRSFTDELKLFVERYGLEWREKETVKTVSIVTPATNTQLKQGVNERGTSRPRA